METATSSEMNPKSSKIRSKKKRMPDSSPSQYPPQSRTQSPPAKDKKYVYVQIIDEGELKWYSLVVDVSRVDGVPKRRPKRFCDLIPQLTPLSSARQNDRSSTYAAVGSTIYRVGGTAESGGMLHKVRCLDTLDPEPSWKRSPSLISDRSDPEVVSLNNRLYVMGSEDSEPWGEVFHPESGTWFPLPTPSPKPNQFGMFSAALAYRNKILVGSFADKFLFIYDETTECWKKLNNKIESWFQVKPVGVGTTLFWFDRSELHAYDVLDKCSSSAHIKHLDRVVSLETFDVSSYYDPTLIHVCDYEFLLICLEDCDTKPGLTFVHCIKFCVTRLPAQGLLKASVQSSESYLIKSPYMMRNALLMYVNFCAEADCENAILSNSVF